MLIELNRWRLKTSLIQNVRPRFFFKFNFQENPINLEPALPRRKPNLVVQEINQHITEHVQRVHNPKPVLDMYMNQATVQNTSFVRHGAQISQDLEKYVFLGYFSIIKGQYRCIFKWSSIKKCHVRFTMLLFQLYKWRKIERYYCFSILEIV